MQPIMLAQSATRSLLGLCTVACTALVLLVAPAATEAAPPPSSQRTEVFAPRAGLPASLSSYPGMGFYVPKQSHHAESQRQVTSLRQGGNALLADKLNTMISTPTATWVLGGTTSAVTSQVKTTTTAAAARNQIPVLAAYNLPFRDCAQYSAGGATSVAAYRAWVDALAAGIGARPALVILEPDGLGIIPWYTKADGTKDWCQPAEGHPATAASDRFAMLSYAVGKLKSLPRATVYLDGGHSGWLGVGDISNRLVKAGVQRADGFFLNVSNYETTEKQLRYGSWVAKCIHYGTNAAEGGWRMGRFADCASQYYPATPADVTTWFKSDAWYATNVDRAAGAPSAQKPLKHFVIDTSRNGRGPWTTALGTYPDAQVWCNPPGRGLGFRPTTATGHPLADAFLWVKVPGESDGQCNRGYSNLGGKDPVWGRIDPAAGRWFPQQALSVVRNAGATVRR